MGRAQKKQEGEPYEIHSIAYVTKSAANDSAYGHESSSRYSNKPSKKSIDQDKLYQKGVAPIDMKTGAQMDEESGKDTGHSERSQGSITGYMGKNIKWGQDYVLHALPTKQATYNLRVAKKEGNVTYLKNWHKSTVTSDIDPSEQPMLDPIRYDGWRSAGEDNHPSKFTENRGYAAPHATLGERRKLAHGNEKDTPLPNLYVQDIAYDLNMDLGDAGRAISQAANDSIEPSQAHHRRAKALKFTLPNEQGRKSLEEKIEQGHSTEGIGHKVGGAGAEVIDFAMWLSGKR